MWIFKARITDPSVHHNGCIQREKLLIILNDEAISSTLKHSLNKIAALNSKYYPKLIALNLITWEWIPLSNGPKDSTKWKGRGLKSIQATFKMPAAFGKSYNWNGTWPQMVIAHKETLEFTANGFAGHPSTFSFCRMVLCLPGPPPSFLVISTHRSWALTPEGVSNIFAICTVNSGFIAFCMPSWKLFRASE